LQTLDTKLSSDNGRLLDGASWSPSLRRGIISAVFQLDEKMVVRKEQLMISVMGPSTTSRESLNTIALILSGPGALFSGNDKMTNLTTSQLTGLELKQSVVDNTGSRGEEFK